ncbi:SDR family oxidoreductase [Propioniciclava sp.]|uniref:SDR family oxidoreductase n=1 Tax=Propioniciclava sp. TaxID=2038686 RepID=UPI0026053FB4|nr:SDR family oxidoreductase [Propioniciclava sp.]
MRILITGGSGTISTAVVERALAEGHEVSVLNRGTRGAPPAGVEHLVGDAKDASALRGLVEGREWDAVVQFLAFTPDDVERDLHSFVGHAGQYVLISSATVYERPSRSVVITEETPLGNPFSAYASAKIACEDALRASSGVPWTIVRPTQTYDERRLPVAIHTGRPGAVLQRMLAGKPVLVHGDGESLWTSTWNADFAVGLVGLLGNPDAYGRAVHITAEESLTWNQMYATLGEVAGVTPDLLHVSTDMLIDVRAELEGALLGDKATSVLFDTSLVRSLVPAYAPATSFRQGVERCWAFLQAHPELLEPDAALDALHDDVAARRAAWAR